MVGVYPMGHDALFVVRRVGTISPFEHLVPIAVASCCVTMADALIWQFGNFFQNFLDVLLY